MEPYLAQVILFAGNFAPRGWAFCQGQLLPINSNQSLYSLLGTTYGGDGRTTFALPDFRGRVPVHVGAGPGLPAFNQGQKGGEENHTLTNQEMPNHNHGAPQIVSANEVDTDELNKLGSLQAIFGTGGTPSTLGDVTTGNNGGTQGHTNMQPYTTLNYIIALQGIFPSRS